MFTMDDGTAAPTDPLDAAFEAQCEVKDSPGVPKVWCVNNVKQWVMEEIATGTIEECRAALETAMTDAEAASKKAGKGNKKERPFFYVTTQGEPPEMETEPFTSMTFTAFPAYCEGASIASLTTLDGVRALEIRRTKTMPHGYRVRIFHAEGTDVNLDTMSEMLDFQSLYNMGYDLNPRPNTGGGASIAFTPDEQQQMRAAEASAKFVDAAAKELADQLKEDNLELLKRAVGYSGMRFCKQILAKTLETEEAGGMMTRDGQRRKTAGGVFFTLMKQEITDPGLTSIIFEEAPPMEPLAPNAIRIGGSADTSELRVDSVAFTPGGTALGSSFDPNAQVFTPPDSSPIA